MSEGQAVDDRRLVHAGNELRPSDPRSLICRSAHDRFGSNESAEEIEVAIVGAGIAGLSAAWQLLRSGVTNVRVFELETEAGEHQDQDNLPSPPIRGARIMCRCRTRASRI